MVESRRVVMAIGIAAALLVAGAGSAAAVDEILLVGGQRLIGELQATEFTLVTPHSTYRVTRANTWRLDLGSASGDHAYLRRGDRVSGHLDVSGFTIRLADGQTVAVPRGNAALVTLGLSGSAPAGRPRDVVILRNGDHVYGDLVGGEFDVTLETGIARFQRDALWRIVVGSITGDAVELTNGDRLSGLVDRPGYTIQTPDGQTLAFGRHEVAVIQFRVPERARPVAGVTPAAPAAPQVAAVPPGELPAPLRAALRDVYFGFDRWDLTPEARQTLENLAAAMKAYPEVRARLEGHADERGTPEYNLALGERRAQAVRDYLVNLGIDTARLDLISYGEERPFDPGRNELAWALNRRVHFVVTSR